MAASSLQLLACSSPQSADNLLVVQKHTFSSGLSSLSRCQVRIRFGARHSSHGLALGRSSIQNCGRGNGAGATTVAKAKSNVVEKAKKGGETRLELTKHVKDLAANVAQFAVDGGRRVDHDAEEPIAGEDVRTKENPKKGKDARSKGEKKAKKHKAKQDGPQATTGQGNLPSSNTETDSGAQQEPIPVNGGVARGEEFQKDLPHHKQPFKDIVVDSIAALHSECREQLDLLGKASDEDVIHDLRVGLRRLRSAVNIFSPFIDIPKQAEARRISKLLRQLGTCRDADVMQETLNKVKAEIGELLNKEAATLDKVQKSMVDERGLMFKDASRAMRSKDTTALLDAWEGWVKEPRFQDEQLELVGSQSRMVVPCVLMPRATTVMMDSAWRIESIETKERERPTTKKGGQKHKKQGAEEHELLPLSTLDNERCAHMHELRKRLRELRYGMEVLGPLYGGRDRFTGALKSVKQLQSALGDLQDLQVFADYLRRRFPSVAPPLAKAVHSLQEQIWAKWLDSRELVYSADGQEQLLRSLSTPKGPKQADLSEEHSVEAAGNGVGSHVNGKADTSPAFNGKAVAY